MFQRQIGRHIVAFEPPDLLHLTARGDIAPEEMRAIGELVRAHAATGYVLGLLNLAELGSIPAESRKVAAESSRHVPLRGAAAYGASFMTRIVAQMVTTTMALVAQQDNPIKFFGTESEARSWLDVRRRELSARR